MRSFDWSYADEVSTCANSWPSSASLVIVPTIVAAGLFWPRSYLFYPVSVATLVLGCIILTRFVVGSRCTMMEYMGSVVAHAVPAALTAWRRARAEAREPRMSMLVSLWTIVTIMATFVAFDVWSYPITPLEFVAFASSTGLLAHAT